MGRVQQIFQLVDAFDNDPISRQFQDIGLDGLNNSDERLFFDSIYLSKLENLYGSSSQAFLKANNDPSADDFHYFRGTDFDNNATTILERYKDFNNTEGNSVTSPENSPESYPTAASTQPDSEDLNRDYTLSETESYFQYKLRLFPNMQIEIVMLLIY